MSDFIVEEAQHTRGAKIKIIGCGGGGCNTIKRMITMGLDHLDLIVANTDAQVLSESSAKTKIQLGEKTTRGLGAGGNPQIGAESANENYEEIKAALDQSDVVFIASGFGGGTGTGATPIVARAAKEVGALVISVVTMPFNFEGANRKTLAENGLAELRKESDSILVIQNEKVKNLIDKSAGAKEVYGMVDEILARAVRGMVSILLEKSDINVDFADVRNIMGSNRGLALMGMGSAHGPNAAMEALENALESPLLDGLNVKEARGVIVHFKHHPDFSFMQVMEAAEALSASFDNKAINFKYGETSDESMDMDRIEVTVIATGFEYANEQKAAQAKEEAKKKSFVLGRTGTYDNVEFNSYMDTPTYLRNQMD